MPRFSATTFLIIITIIHVKRVESLQCYVCRSDIDKSCEGELAESHLMTCPQKKSGGSSYCRKIEQQLLFKGDKEKTVIRECASEKNPSQCYKSIWSDAVFLEVCECDEDMCNGTGSIILAFPEGVLRLISCLTAIQLINHLVLR